MNKTVFILSLLLAISFAIKAQTIEGDSLLSILGSKVDAPAANSFITSYDIKNKNAVKYSTTQNGIDMSARHDSIISINLYPQSSIYGSYTHKLPRGLVFGDTAGEVTKLLGKATTAYTNSGYSEYAIGNNILTCWFEKGVLSQVSISLK